MRISDWSSDVCSSDLAIETIDRGNGIVLQTGQGPMMVRRDRLIRTMDDSELEDFCRRWVSGRSGYFEVKRFGQAGDMGRDVVGFCAPQRHEGNWDNYQCQQYQIGRASCREDVCTYVEIS